MKRAEMKFAESFLHKLTQRKTVPLRRAGRSFIEALLPALFAEYRETTDETGLSKAATEKLLLRAGSSLKPHMEEKICSAFADSLPSIYETLLTDAQAIFEGDPAAKSIEEVISTYPGFLAIAHYRIAHFFSDAGEQIFARVITEYAHEKTGIDIHPGAKIAHSFCIDHGTGVVIGETAEIKENVKMYQGVALGAMSVTKDMAEKKRHPTIEKNVVIYANATILGGGTIIGQDSVIGGNVWVTESIPAGSRVYHKGEVVVRRAS